MQPGNPTVQVPATPTPARLERPPRSAAEIREEMNRAETRIQAHTASLRRELTLADINIGAMPVLDHIRKNPLIAVGITAGVFAAIALTRTVASRERPKIDRREEWWRMYIDDLLDDAAARVGRNGNADEALRAALRRRAPVIYVEVEREEATVGRKSALTAALASVANTVLGFGLKFAMDRFAHEFAPSLEAAVRRAEPTVTKTEAERTFARRESSPT